MRLKVKICHKPILVNCTTILFNLPIDEQMMEHNKVLIIFITITISALLFIPTTSTSRGQSNMTSSIPDRVSEIGIAEGIYQNRLLSVGTSVKNIVILIPNEGHESPDLPEELRLINQPYVPANIIVGLNTQVSWINGDVGHQHTVTVTDENAQQVYSSGEFDFNDITEPLAVNNSGKYTYYESNVNKEDSDFVMAGTISVEENPSNTNQLPQTVGFLMVPAKDLNEHVSELTGRGIDVIDQYTFKDLRGGQKDTGPEQTLLLLGSTSGRDELVLALETIISTLPYS